MQYNNEVLVSVIMPIYNAEEFLRETLDRVANQTLKEIEIICVDDGSSDGSPAILQEYANADERFVIIKQENQYAGVARNNGLQKAMGKYIVFWDADDLFELEALEKMYNRMEEDGADICICDANQMDYNTEEVIVRNIYLQKQYLPENRPFSKTDIPENIFRFTTNVPWNKMFKREFVEEHKLQFQSLKQANDTYFSMMALFFAKSITYVDEKLVNYRLDNDKSLTGKASDTTMCAYESYEKTRLALMAQEDFVNSEQLQKGFANRALQGLVYSLFSQNNIDSYTKLYQVLADEGLKKFGVVDKEEDYFIVPKQYERKQQITTMRPDEFLLAVLKEAQKDVRNLRSRLGLKNQEIREQNKTIKERDKQIKSQQQVLDSLAVRTALKTKKILTLNGKLRYKK